jgi:dipeptidyl aminopeptidase/acylaminoacyl peptidase
MNQKQIAPYGSWKSPITSDLVVKENILLLQLALDGEDVYWLECRPQEKGRYVIVKRSPDGTITEVTPAPFSARTRVHEYGGASFMVADGVVYFSNDADQRLHRQRPGLAPEPLTPEIAWRYADAVMDHQRKRLICVREDHTQAPKEASNTLVAVSLDTGEVSVLVEGNDFYSSPRLSPDGRQLAWLTWNHPNMPWDGCELWVAALDDAGEAAESQWVAGKIDESIFQPEWSPEGELHFVSDRSGWWNLYRWRAGEVEALCPMEAEFGGPQWVFDVSSFGFAEGRLVCRYQKEGQSHLSLLDMTTLKLEPLDLPYTFCYRLRVNGGAAVMIAGSTAEPESVVYLDLATRKPEILVRSSSWKIDPDYISIPRAIEFPTTNGLTAHAFYYPPTNQDFAGPANERPPLLVTSHGGPTSAAWLLLDPEVQFWTSRGFAVVDVNYGGSTGYGRAYRERLNGQWGIVDMDDCTNAALYLAGQGLVDGNRLAIRGGSAGGYTTLCCLTFKDVFKAGASYFGISDLEVFTVDTHKFESRYLERLVGPYPEKRDLYLERSPIHHIEKLSSALILFQGLEDKIVLPNQAEMMFAAMRAKGLPVAYLPFEGEGHGFRQAATVKRALEAEMYFYAKVFGFELAEAIEPMVIENF